jgi:hypothetical protein
VKLVVYEMRAWLRSSIVEPDGRTVDSTGIAGSSGTNDTRLQQAFVHPSRRTASMDEKTEELRDIFIDATGSDTVTERQEEGPGSLADEPSGDPERIRELIGLMRERYEFTTSLSDGTLVAVVRAFFDDADDAAIAERIDADAETVFEARMDLHLLRESDTADAPLDLVALRKLLVDGASVADCVERVDADAATVRHYARVIETRLEATRANDRFRDEFAELLTDEAISDRMAQDARKDGLREATEDMETDVSF